MAKTLLVLSSLFLIGLAFYGMLSGDESSRNGPADDWMTMVLNDVSGDSITASIEVLASERSRRLFSSGAGRAVAFISSKLTGYGWDVRLEDYKIEGPAKGNESLVNIIADRPGQDGDGVLVVCTHYDSRGEGLSEDAPGADDNASGTAVILEIARVIGKLPTSGRKTIELAFFGGEEDSFAGSSAYVGRFLIGGGGRRLVCAINVDMVGYDQFGPRDFVVFSDEYSIEFSRIMQDCSDLYTQLRCETTITSSADSDHLSFWRAGLKAVSVWEGYDHNPYYHSSQDTVDKLSSVFMEEIARALLCAIAEGANVDWKKRGVEP